MNKPILTTTFGNNSDLLPNVFSVYVKDYSSILDMTYGKGVFWKNIDTSKYNCIFNDINPAKGDIHEDFRHTTHNNCMFDVVILDPPYMFGAGGKDSIMDESYENGMYRNKEQKGTGAIVELYKDGMKEAFRLLKPKGILMVKCMDLIQGGKQQRIHFSVCDFAVNELMMIDEDLFILMQSSTPVMRHNYQLHARKNNSFLWIFRK